MTAWQSNPYFEMFNKVIFKSPQIYTVPITVPDLILCTGMFFLKEMNSLAS